MKRLTLSAFCTTLVLASPVHAQSYSVVVLGPSPARQQTTHALTSPTETQVVELAAEKACEQPFIRDLKGRVLYDQCLEAARTEARTQLLAGQTRPGRQLAAR